MSLADLSSEEISERILALVPQQKPFRFIDRIIEVDEDHIVGQYQFREDEYFYAGHFPGQPVTPGVILIETMAQIGVVSLAIYQMLKQANPETSHVQTLFAETEAEFHHQVLPGDLVEVRAEKIYWRRRKLKAKAGLYLADGRLAASATLAGMGY
ncbi:MAG: 3-hydroxyacyl-ACP dehydratase FabZ family protein [Oligoflexus sp.]